MKIFIFAFLFLFTGQPDSQDNSTELPTGWYHITTENTGLTRELNKTGEYYFLEPEPIITPKNMKTTEFKTGYDGKIYLAIQFDAAGTKAWARATARATGTKLGFILDDKLIQAPFVNGQITGGVAAIWDDSKTELERIKKAIQRNKDNSKN